MNLIYVVVYSRRGIGEEDEIYAAFDAKDIADAVAKTKRNLKVVAIPLICCDKILPA